MRLFVLFASVVDVARANLKKTSSCADTEIDWIAYMQEVGGVMGGELDYLNLKGDTGPLVRAFLAIELSDALSLSRTQVYPGAFVYLYSVLYFITGGGKNILLAQCLFAALLVATVGALLLVFRSSKKISFASLLLLLASRRLHSIYVLVRLSPQIVLAFECRLRTLLRSTAFADKQQKQNKTKTQRLFNDCWAMFFLFLAIYYFCIDKWSRGCFLYRYGREVLKRTF